MTSTSLELKYLTNELREDCPMRHENGNCTAIGGFCTAVNDPICEGLHNAYKHGKCDGMMMYRSWVRDKIKGTKMMHFNSETECSNKDGGIE